MKQLHHGTSTAQDVPKRCKLQKALTRHYPSRCLYEPTSLSKSLAIQKQNAYLIVNVLLH